MLIKTILPSLTNLSNKQLIEHYQTKIDTLRKSLVESCLLQRWIVTSCIKNGYNRFRRIQRIRRNRRIRLRIVYIQFTHLTRLTKLDKKQLCAKVLNKTKRQGWPTDLPGFSSRIRIAKMQFMMEFRGVNRSK